MKPPFLRPSSMPALAKCPRYSPDQSEGEEQKNDGTKRHTALGLYLADDPTWSANLGDWDAAGVEWAGDYIRTHAPLGTYALEIEQRGVAVLPDLTEIPGTPDVFCGPVLFDLKGRDIDSYREQMETYALMRGFAEVEVHVLYATERRSSTFTVIREDAEREIQAIADAVANPRSQPSVCDFCGWCANRTSCPALAKVGSEAADILGLRVPEGEIENITDADELRDLKLAADAVVEWGTAAKKHVTDMAVKRGVIATGFKIQTRKGHPKITDCWAAIQASGMTPEALAPRLTISLPDLAEAYAALHEMKPKAAREDIEQRLGALIERGATVSYLTPIN